MMVANLKISLYLCGQKHCLTQYHTIMKKIFLALLVVACGLISCSKPSIDDQLNKLEVAVENRDCKVIRSITKDLIDRREELSDEQGLKFAILIFPVLNDRDCDCDIEEILDGE